MKIVGRQTAAFLITALLLTACSSGGNEAGVSGQNGPAAASNRPETTAQAEPASASPAATQTASPSPPPSPSASPEPAPEEITVQYRMNKNFDIVPLGEEAPKKVVLLTFDDGPKDAEVIGSLMDTLDKHDAKAIFFVNGYRVKENPDLLKLIHERGGIIGNHSWDHIVLKDRPYEEVKQQLENVQDIVREITGEAPRFFRPPHGAGGEVGRQAAAENSMLYMNWSVGSLDWEMKESTPDKTEKLISTIQEQLHSGSNILMHELPWTAEALDSLLTGLSEQGYGFVDPRSISSEEPG